MSKSFSKIIRFGICNGSNTEYYRTRRRNICTKEKQVIRNILSHYDLQDFDDLYTPLNIPFSNPWHEPTDGSFTLCGKASRKDGVKYRGVYLTKNNKIKR